LKSRRSFSYTIITKNSCFWLCCCFLHNSKMHYWWLATWLDLTELGAQARQRQFYCSRYVRNGHDNRHRPNGRGWGWQG
jgi:hypothetical protein